MARSALPGRPGKRLTPLQVAHAKTPPGKDRVEIPDAGSGLYLIVQASGSKSWAHRYAFNGKREKLTFGPVYVPHEDEEEPAGAPEVGKAMTLAQARRLIADQQHRLERGENPADALRAEKAKRKAPAVQLQPDADAFEHVARDFLLRYAAKQQRPSTYAETLRVLGFVVKDGKVEVRDADACWGPAIAWRGKPIQQIRRRDVNDLLDSVEDERGGHAANATLAAVRKMLNWAVERELIEASPAQGVKRRLDPEKRERVLNDGELRLVWLAAERIGWPFGYLVKLLALTGCRRDEWAEARWSEIDFKRKVFELPAERSKNGRAHTIPLAPQALAVLEQLQKDRLLGEPGWIFTTGYGRRKPGEHPTLVPISGFSKFKARLDRVALEVAQEDAEKAGESPADVKPLEAWRLHDLRRTAVTGLARLGVKLEVIERAVNHVSESFGGIVSVYQKHTFSDEIRDALERWAAGLERVAAGEQLARPKVIELAERR